jgi:hypothetical protein
VRVGGGTVGDGKDTTIVSERNNLGMFLSIGQGACSRPMKRVIAARMDERQSTYRELTAPAKFRLGSARNSDFPNAGVCVQRFISDSIK